MFYSNFQVGLEKKITMVAEEEKRERGSDGE